MSDVYRKCKAGAPIPDSVDHGSSVNLRITFFFYRYRGVNASSRTDHSVVQSCAVGAIRMSKSVTLIYV